MGIHKTDLIQYLMGEYVAETTAVITTLDKKDGSGNLIGWMTMPSVSIRWNQAQWEL